MTQTPPLMSKDKTRQKSCPHCGNIYESPEILPFFFLRPGNTITCLRCTKRSFLVPKKGVQRWIMLAGATVVWFIGFALTNLLIPALTYSSADGSFWYSLWTLIGGVFIGTYLARLVMKTWNWRQGWLSDDDLYQSMWDFGQ